MAIADFRFWIEKILKKPHGTAARPKRGEAIGLRIQKKKSRPPRLFHDEGGRLERKG
jgi:hypothetical protein